MARSIRGFAAYKMQSWLSGSNTQSAGLAALELPGEVPGNAGTLAGLSKTAQALSPGKGRRRLCVVQEINQSGFGLLSSNTPGDHRVRATICVA
jgi:hypothetical protein